MKNLYFNIWANAFFIIKSNPAFKRDWKIVTLIVMSIPQMMILAFFMAIVQREVLSHSFYNLKLSITNIESIDSTLEFLILYLFPLLLINYFNIYYNKKYLKIIDDYKIGKKNYFLFYFLILTFFPLLILIIALLINRYA